MSKVKVDYVTGTIVRKPSRVLTKNYPNGNKGEYVLLNFKIDDKEEYGNLKGHIITVSHTLINREGEVKETLKEGERGLAYPTISERNGEKRVFWEVGLANIATISNEQTLKELDENHLKLKTEDIKNPEVTSKSDESPF